MTDLNTDPTRTILVHTVLDQICNGTITFADAANLLGIAKDEVESMLDDYPWMPTAEQMRTICEAERQTLEHIRATVR